MVKVRVPVRVRVRVYRVRPLQPLVRKRATSMEPCGTPNMTGR